eukprot:XP_011671986.1 PREDICTED: uncharacterized protein LOC100889312 isoform X2 [Strongylocentrotus purpuratus]
MSDRGAGYSLPAMPQSRRAKSAELYHSQHRAQSAKSTHSAIETPSYNAVSRAVYLRRLNLSMSNKADVSNLQRSATPNSFNSNSRLKQVPLPQVKSNPLLRSSSPRGVKNVSMSGDRYLGTSKSGQQDSQSSVHKSYLQYDAPSLPKREQVHRFEEEQTNLYITRTMKRKSEILSHRVDRMYYLCGSGSPVQGRYEVNDSELQRLREFSRVRNNSRVNSGRSLSGRSVPSLTESIILTETRSKRSPLGSPLGSPRCTPVPTNIDLTVAGSGVSHSGDKVKGHAASNQVQIEDARVGHMSSGSQDANVINGGEKEGQRDRKTEDSSEKQNMSPHGTGEEERDEKDRNEHENDSEHDDKQNGHSERSYIEGGQTEEDRQTVAPEHCPTDGHNIDMRCREDVSGRVVGGEGGGGDAVTELSSAHTIQDSDGCQRDVDEDKEGSRDGREDVRLAGGEGGGVDDVFTRISSGDSIQHSDGCHGDGHKDEGGLRITQDGEESVTSKDQSLGGRLVESIAPGLKLDKTPFSMKKSDVYLTEFVDPKHKDLYDEAASPLNAMRIDGKQLDNYDGQITLLERKLDKVDTLTQGVDDIGHVTRLDYDLSEVKTDEKELCEEGYDSGVFGRARSEEERRKAIQLREERKEAKNSVKIEQNEAQRVRKEADKQRALKQTNKIKFKMTDVYNFISSRQREIFSQKFRELDTDGNGQITLKELTKKMHANVSKNDIHLLHKVFDLNKDKTIDHREFVTVAALNDKLIGQEVTSEAAPLELNLNRLSLHITAYKEMFDVVDQNGDGRLSMDEIMFIITVSTGIDIGIDKEAVRSIHNTIDKDGNGSIDFVEFLTFIPFFQKIHQQIIGKPVTFEEMDEARIAVKKAMRR